MTQKLTGITYINKMNFDVLVVYETIVIVWYSESLIGVYFDQTSCQIKKYIFGSIIDIKIIIARRGLMMNMKILVANQTRTL